MTGTFGDDIAPIPGSNYSAHFGAGRKTSVVRRQNPDLVSMQDIYTGVRRRDGY